MRETVFFSTKDQKALFSSIYRDKMRKLVLGLLSVLLFNLGDCVCVSVGTL